MRAGQISVLAAWVIVVVGCAPKPHGGTGATPAKGGASCHDRCKVKHKQCEEVCLQQDCDVAPSACKAESDGCSVQCKTSLDACTKGC